IAIRLAALLARRLLARLLGLPGSLAILCDLRCLTHLSLHPTFELLELSLLLRLPGAPRLRGDSSSPAAGGCHAPQELPLAGLTRSSRLRELQPALVPKQTQQRHSQPQLHA